MLWGFPVIADCIRGSCLSPPTTLQFRKHVRMEPDIRFTCRVGPLPVPIYSTATAGEYRINMPFILHPSRGGVGTTLTR